jgi:hypothetical protein
MKRSLFVIAILIVAGLGVAAGYFLRPTVTSEVEETEESEQTSGSETARTDAPIYFATMTHMEGNHTDDRDRGVFDRHVAGLRYALQLATEYNAKITVESEQPFAKASIAYGVNVLKEFVDAGMGVGTHCDINPRRDYPLPQLVRELTTRKQLVDTLVGAEHNRGCSGAGGASDWASGMIRAGFTYIDGIVGFHYLSMPLSERPDGWTDDYINETAYHDNAPQDLTLRYHPFFVKNALDFVPDEDGTLLVSAGSVGTLQQLEESRAEGADYASCAPNCPLETGDVDALIAEVREIADLHDGSAIGKIDVHIQTSDWEIENDTVLRYFFTEMNKLVDEGVIEWATQGEVYDAVVDWTK